MNASKWILCAALVVTATVCARLGFWQLARLEHRRAANALVRRQRSRPALELGASSPAVGDTASARRLAGRRVHAAGRYDTRINFVLRNQSRDGEPGVDIVTPLVLPGDSVAVLVDRGWVPAPDGMSVLGDSFPEPGPREVTGEGALWSAAPDGGARFAAHSPWGVTETWEHLDPAFVLGRVPYRLLPVYVVQQSGGPAPALPRRAAVAVLGDGPHLGYAAQWFCFALLALAGAAFVLRDGGRGRAAPPR